jgi:hypothetical protein
VIGLLLAEVPALPLHTAGKYVAAAYIVLFALVLVYLAIMAIRLSRIERELGDLLELSEGEQETAPAVTDTSEDRESTLAYPIKEHPPLGRTGK